MAKHDFAETMGCICCWHTCRRCKRCKCQVRNLRLTECATGTPKETQP